MTTTCLCLCVVIKLVISCYCFLWSRVFFLFTSDPLNQFISNIFVLVYCNQITFNAELYVMSAYDEFQSILESDWLAILVLLLFFHTDIIMHIDF